MKFTVNISADGIAENVAKGNYTSENLIEFISRIDSYMCDMNFSEKLIIKLCEGLSFDMESEDEEILEIMNLLVEKLKARNP